MDGYLLDTNILLYLMGKRTSRHGPVWRRRRACLDGTPIYVSPFALAEFNVGCCLTSADATAARQEAVDFLDTHGFQVPPLTKHTAPHYGELKARLMRRFDREKLTKKHRGAGPEGWPDPATGEKLGADEIDLLIAAQAIERNLVLVSGDSMRRIREVAPELHVEDWAAP